MDPEKEKHLPIIVFASDIWDKQTEETDSGGKVSVTQTSLLGRGHEDDDLRLSNGVRQFKEHRKKIKMSAL